MNAINSISNPSKATTLPAGYHRAQEILSNYSTRNEFTEGAHTLLSCTEIDMPPSVRTLLTTLKKFVFDIKRIGVLDAEYETISKWTGMSVRNVERAFSWLRKIGAIESYRTKRQNGNQGFCIKVFVGLGTIQRIVREVKKSFMADNVADNVADRLAVCLSAETPTESKAEGSKNAEDISTITLNPLYKNINIKYIKDFKDLEEEKKPKTELKLAPKKIKFKSEFSKEEIKQAKKFIAPQMQNTLHEMNWNDDFASRFICYMQMAGMTYVSPSEIRAKNKEIVKADGKDKKGRKIEDMALYMIKGIAMKRQDKNADINIYKMDKAKKQLEEKKKQEEQQKQNKEPLPFYNYLEGSVWDGVRKPQNDSEYQDTHMEPNEPQEPIDGTEKEYEEAFCYGDSFFEHEPFEIFDKEAVWIDGGMEWIAPLPPLSDKDELKYYDRIISQEPQEEPQNDSEYQEARKEQRMPQRPNKRNMSDSEHNERDTSRIKWDQFPHIRF